MAKKSTDKKPAKPQKAPKAVATRKAAAPSPTRSKPAKPAAATVSNSAPTLTVTTPAIARAQPSLAPVLTLSHQQIAERAYAIWQAKGRPDGRDAENWREAQEQLRRELLRK